jgi:glycerol-3-phosphate dehydrogenase
MSGQLTALDPPPQEKTFCGSGLRSIRYDEDLQQLDYIPTTDIMQFVQCWENNTAKYTGITEGVIQRLWTRLRNREMFPGLKTPERADASLQQKDQQSESDTLLQQQESESEKYTVSQSIVKLHNKLLDKLKGMEDELTVIRDQGGEEKIAEEANTLITLKGADHITGTFIGDSE